MPIYLSVKLVQFSTLKKTVKHFVSIVFLFLSFSALCAEKSTDLVLSGGALKTCSSYTQKACKSTKKVEGGKQKLLFTFGQKPLSRFQSLIPLLSDSVENEKKIKKLYSILMDINSFRQEGGYTKNTFLSTIDEVAEKQNENRFTRSLSDPIYFALLDTHEVFQQSPTGERLKERVSVPDTANPNSISIYNAFVDRAKHISKTSQPSIVVITASSRDFFESADFYMGAMNSLEAKAVWLPLSAAWQYSQYDNSCQNLDTHLANQLLFDVARRYPILFESLQNYCKSPESLFEVLRNADGIFFNGGDQSKTLASLLTKNGKESQEMSIIRDKLKNKTVVVGGTSAGTAVQAGGTFAEYFVPMLTNGLSTEAFQRGVIPVSAPSQRCNPAFNCNDAIRSDDVTYRPTGGTGFFSAGLLDTHFSERDREARLAMATFSSNQKFGFGIDETTALLVSINANSQLSFNVIGEGGVFIADLTHHQFNSIVENGKVIRRLGALAHYLPSGSRAELRSEQLEILLSAAKDTTPISTYKEKGVWREKTSVLCKSPQLTSWQYQELQFMVAPSKETAFQLSRAYCGYSRLPFVISN